MVKKVGFQWRIANHDHLLVKIGVSIVLLGLGLHLFYSNSAERVSEISYSDHPAVEKLGKCDIFDGDWVHLPESPRYTNRSCQRIEDHQNCMKNGRPDSDYLYWRWKPRDCVVTLFDGKRFLEMMRNKTWAFIGDSISRNHVQSLLCLLSLVDEVVDVYHDEEWKSQTWRVPSYGVTIFLIWSPFLTKANIYEDINGVSSSELELHLDVLDKKWTDGFEKFDYIVISGGKWFLKTSIFYEEGKIVGCHYCPGRNLKELGFEYSYKKVLQLVFNYITTSNHKVLALFRTTTPSHFENGEWHNGGTCERTKPFKGNEISISDVDNILRNIELEQFKRAVEQTSWRTAARLQLFDITKLLLLRPDGHPGPYRMFYPFAKDKDAKVQNDCLHWCLPGPLDTWNDLIMKMLQDSLIPSTGYQLITNNA